MLVGSVTGCTPDELREMAGSFAGEMAWLGYAGPRILELFRKPFYAGPHLAWQELGEEAVRRIIEESVEFWSHCRVVVKDSACPDGEERT